MNVTDKQTLALEALRKTWLTTSFVWPAELGYAISPDGMRKDGSRQLKPQGAGRIGGAMGARLKKLGLAVSRGRGYAISSAGNRYITNG